MSDPFDLDRYAVGDSAPDGAHSDQISESRGSLSDGGRLEVGSPPLIWLVGAIVVALVGAALAAFVLRSGPVTLLPWVLAGPIGIVLLGVYSIVDTRRRALAVYAAGNWVMPFYIAVIVLIFGAVIVTALNIASWVGHL